MSVHHHFATFFKKQEDLQPFAYAASKSLAEGSICVDTTADKKILFEDYFEDLKDLKVSANWAANASVLVGNENDVEKPFVLHKHNFYITRYFNYETQIIRGIKSLIEEGEKEWSARFARLRSSSQFQKLVEGQQVKQGADWQLVAAAMAFVNNFSIITGGPGTGKTTTVAKILGLLYEEDPDLDVRLAAPTGKAAMRMKEALAGNKYIPEAYKEKIDALAPFTIHRLLGPRHQSPYFKHDSENKLEADVIIIDEASMIDVALFSKLLAAIKASTRLIILGDRNQLASVEAGSLLGDLCTTVSQKNSFSPEVTQALSGLIPGMDLSAGSEEKLLQDHITVLKYSWRFEKQPEFREVSEAVIRNDCKIIESWFMEEGLQGNIKLDPDHEEKLFNDFVKGYKDYIAIANTENPGYQDIAAAIRKFNELRILAVIRNGKNGVAGLNSRVEKYLSKKDLINTGKDFYEFRPVMVTRNHSDLGLFNGDVGIVRRDPKDPDKVKVWFLSKEQEADRVSGEKEEAPPVRGFSPGLLADVETVFAMTVHKSQGSEFEKVLLVMPKVKELPLLTRELLYTGITRAKSQLLIQGTKEVILKAAEGQVKRASGITNRI